MAISLEHARHRGPRQIPGLAASSLPFQLHGLFLMLLSLILGVWLLYRPTCSIYSWFQFLHDSDLHLALSGSGPQGNTWSKSFHASLCCQISHFSFPTSDSSSSFYVGPSHRSQTAQGWNTLEPTFSGQLTLAGGRGSISISGDWSWGVSTGAVLSVNWHTSATRTLKPSSGHISSVFLSSISSSFIWYCIILYF